MSSADCQEVNESITDKHEKKSTDEEANLPIDDEEANLPIDGEEMPVSSKEEESVNPTTEAHQLRFRGEPKKVKDHERPVSGEDLDKKVLDKKLKNTKSVGTDVKTEDFLALGGDKMNTLAQVIFAFLWWSVFLAMPGVLWFYSLSQMKITGYEAMCFLLLSPVLMVSESVHTFVTKPFGLMVVRMLTMMGVLSFLTGSTILHVILMSVGSSCGVLALGGSLWSKTPIDRYQHGYLHMMGYLLYLAVRVWGSSYIFMKTSLNLVAIFVGVVMSVIMYANESRSSLNTSRHPPPGSTKKSKLPAPSPQPLKMVATGVAFGALLFLTSYLFGDVAVIVRWSGTPLPSVGPKPNPWGMATLLALSLGLTSCGTQTELVESVPWLGTGMAFSMTLYFGTAYVAFFGGLVVAAYTASLWPLLFKRIVSFPAGQVLGIAMATYLFFLLLSVWVVGFGFVPGGNVTRERTDVLLGLLIFCCGIGTCSVFRAKPDKKVDKALFVQEASEEQLLDDQEVNEFHWVYKAGTVLILLFALLGYAWRRQPPYQAPIKVKEQQKMFSAGVWSLQFGYDNKGWPSMERAAQFIEDTEVDVIGLLETDAARPYIGSHDIASWLGERLHMHVDYGQGTKEHTWGVTVLSKYPILKSQHYKLPSPKGEIAPAILATVNISGEPIDIYVVHFGNRRDDADRKLQVKMTVEILKNCTHPVVLLGYLTTEPGCRDYSMITDVVKDIDPYDTERFREYIFFHNLSKMAYARISHGGLSDTEMQIGKFFMYDPPDDREWDYSIDPADVPPWVQFPDKFGGRWTGEYVDNSRHHFHMGTPKYYYVH